MLQVVHILEWKFNNMLIKVFMYLCHCRVFDNKVNVIVRNETFIVCIANKI